ncbi:potassium channel family protein [Candidatus Methanomassiliicoccus intestinalis]|uniref:potassium channel family protein n=1 Tax=Candidatus Methanomassiliicoccus intestinalis TaxID=1406512 RepID=UPI0037DC01AF
MNAQLSDRNPNFATMIALMGALSVLNSVLTVIYDGTHIGDISKIMNYLITIIFAINFVYRFLSSTSPKRYFVHEYGWLDILCIIPFYWISWIFRGFRSAIIFGRMGWKKLKYNLRHEGAEAILFLGVFIIILIIEFGSIAAYSFETADPNANIQTPTDALWWSIVTIATVGYGDFYPVTLGGRLTAVVMMTAGIGIFATLTGYLANRYLTQNTSKVVVGKDGQISILQRLEGNSKEEFDKAYQDIAERLERIEEKFNDEHK